MTFSIVARCPRNGMLGVATASKSLASGSLVPYCKAGVGAIASQSFVNPYLGVDGLVLLEQGLPAERVLERLLQGDAGRDIRQAGVVDRDGRTAAHTGEQCIRWAGHVTGGGYVCLGNIIWSENIVNAMARAFEATLDGELPARLLAALEAGEEAGGDRRGRQSAGLFVVATEDYPYCDLRVDDHQDPLAELRRLYDIFKQQGEFLASMPQRDNPTPDWEAIWRERIEIETDLAQRAGHTGRE